MMKCVIIVSLLIFSINSISAEVINGDFNENADNWTAYADGQGSYEWSEFTGYDETGHVGVSVNHPKDILSEGIASYSQYVDTTGYRKLRFYGRTALWPPGETPGVEAYGIVYIGIKSVSLGHTYNGWNWYEIDIVGSGVQEIKLECTGEVTIIQSANRGSYLNIDEVSLIDQYMFTLSGYVKDSEGNPMHSYLSVNGSENVESNETTGYYEFLLVEEGSHLITVTSPTHEDYSDSVTVSGDTEKNITMTSLSPILTWTDTDTTTADVFLFWKRNIVVDNVRIYKDTETRLLTTVGSGSTLSGLYSDKNLDCSKGYVYWLQPMDGSVAGPKYRVDAETEPCTEGGGGDTVLDPTQDPTPVVTPGPTVPPEINMTQEEWLNLTLEQKQEILANITLMAPVDQLFSPLLEFKWDELYVWSINLLLILCAIIALDSITTQKISEYTGLLAVIPGGIFAYLCGYLVI